MDREKNRQDESLLRRALEQLEESPSNADEEVRELQGVCREYVEADPEWQQFMDEMLTEFGWPDVELTAPRFDSKADVVRQAPSESERILRRKWLKSLFPPLQARPLALRDSEATGTARWQSLSEPLLEQQGYSAQYTVTLDSTQLFTVELRFNFLRLAASEASPVIVALYRDDTPVLSASPDALGEAQVTLTTNDLREEVWDKLNFVIEIKRRGSESDDIPRTTARQ